jgi:hypothetical protein
MFNTEVLNILNNNDNGTNKCFTTVLNILIKTLCFKHNKFGI